VSDPVRAGFVASVAHPGGNITGFALYEYAFAVKWLELLETDCAGRHARGGHFRSNEHRIDRTIAGAGASSRIVQRAIVGLSCARCRRDQACHRDICTWTERWLGCAAECGRNHSPRTAHCIGSETPLTYSHRYYATSGGLASYSVNIPDLYRRAASYVDRILKSEKPSDLPVQFADKFEFVLNLKTAKALGLDPPISLLARADEVIE
jgi:putative tryptophan/tyrosine transport system substrate-binding protein